MFNAAPSQTIQTPSGSKNIAFTLRVMREQVLKGRQNPYIRQFTAALITNARLKQKDYLGEIHVIHNFVRDNVRYVRDIRNVETIHDADFILKNRYGDCDDKTILCAAMLESIGFTTRIRAVGFEKIGYCHVLLDVLFKGNWIPAETTEPVGLGWNPPNITNSMILKV